MALVSYDVIEELQALAKAYLDSEAAPEPRVEPAPAERDEVAPPNSADYIAPAFRSQFDPPV